MKKVCPKYYHSYFTDNFVIVMLWNKDCLLEMVSRL